MKPDPTQELDAARDALDELINKLNKGRFYLSNRTGEFPPSMKGEKGFAVDGIIITSLSHVEDVQRMLVCGLMGDRRGTGLIGRALNRLEDNTKQAQTGEWDAKREAGK